MTDVTAVSSPNNEWQVFIDGRLAGWVWPHYGGKVAFPANGTFSADELRAIADKLDEVNTHKEPRHD